MPRKPKQDLKIYPVKIDRSKLGEVDMGGILPNIPFLALCIGKVKSGKTVLYNSLFLRDDFYGDKFQVKCLLSPSAHQDAVNQHLCEEFDYVIDEVNEEVISQLLTDIEKEENDDKWLMIFDDVIGSIEQKRQGKPDLISSLATKYRHIANAKGDEGKLSMFICTQYFNFITPVLRNNASCYFLMGHFSKDELEQMAKALSVFGGDKNGFIKIYNLAKKEPYDFLYLNMSTLKAYRNFDELIWDENGFIKKDDGHERDLSESDDEREEEDSGIDGENQVPIGQNI